MTDLRDMMPMPRPRAAGATGADGLTPQAGVSLG